MGVCIWLRPALYFHHAGGYWHFVDVLLRADGRPCLCEHPIHHPLGGLRLVLVELSLLGIHGDGRVRVRPYVPSLSLGRLQETARTHLVGRFGPLLALSWDSALPAIYCRDQRAYWATTVGVEIMDKTPLLGDFMARFLKGGATPGQMTRVASSSFTSWFFRRP